MTAATLGWWLAFAFCMLAAYFGRKWQTEAGRYHHIKHAFDASKGERESAEAQVEHWKSTYERLHSEWVNASDKARHHSKEVDRLAARVGEIEALYQSLPDLADVKPNWPAVAESTAWKENLRPHLAGLLQYKLLQATREDDLKKQARLMHHADLLEGLLRLPTDAATYERVLSQAEEEHKRRMGDAA